LWPLSHPFDYYSPALFKEWSADIFLSRSVGRPFLFFYSVGHMSAFRAGSFFLFFLGSHQEQEQLSWGIRARLLYLSPCLLFLFFFPASSSYGTTGEKKERMGESVSEKKKSVKNERE
jgi:hypothetical protein